MSSRAISLCLLGGVFGFFGSACGQSQPDDTLFLAALPPAPKTVGAPGEWTQWRGPNRDGICPETGLLQKWSETGPKLMWTASGLGGGYSSVAIAGGRAFTMGRLEGGNFLVARDLKDGAQLWTTKVGSGGAPNCTPTVDGDRVYALGREGDLICAHVATGKVLWKKNFPRDFGGKMMSGWGYSESPLIDGQRLVCTPGARDAIVASLDKRTGEVLWRAAMPTDSGSAGGDGAAYSSIVISQGAGVRQYVQLVGRGVIGVAADAGEVLWTYNRIANGTANVPTPIVRGDFVFCSTGYGTGAALLKLTKRGSGVEANEVYFLDSKVMQNHHGGMILLGNHVYCGHGHNNGFPLCIEMLTGKIAWRPGRGPGDSSAAITYADGHFYFRYQNGVMALIEATPSEYRLKGTFEIASKLGESWPHPVVAGGRLYLRDQDVLHCYDIKKPAG